MEDLTSSVNDNFLNVELPLGSGVGKRVYKFQNPINLGKVPAGWARKTIIDLAKALNLRPLSGLPEENLWRMYEELSNFVIRSADELLSQEKE